MSSLEDQVTALRHGVGVFWLGRDIFSVRGDDAESYLQGQLSQDVVALGIGATADSLLLQPDGKLTALLRITRIDGHEFVLDTDAGFGDSMVARLKKFMLRSKVEIERLPWRSLALRGSGVAIDAALATFEDNDALRPAFEWNGWGGIDLLGPELAVPEGLSVCDREAVEACRIISGIPAMGSELTDKTIAAEAGLVDRSVSFTKGCYTGQELVARLDARGNNVPRRLVGVIGGSEQLAFGMTLHAGEEPDDVAADKVVGTITSAAWSPELGAWAAFGLFAPDDWRTRSRAGALG